jgi:hypothetical protein
MRYSHTGTQIWSVEEVASAPDAFSAETMAVHMAVWDWQRMVAPGSRVTMYTDCQVLVWAIQEGDGYQCPLWRAAEILATLRRTLEEESERVEIGMLGGK